MDRLDPHALTAFEAVIETGSATLAAGKLNLTQPSVTRAIVQLERQTGLLLFERGRFGMRLTAEGRLLADEVARSFSGLDRLAATAQAIRLGIHGQLVVVAMPVYAEGFISRALGQLAAEAPDVRARIEMDTPRDIIAKVLDGRADLGVIAGTFTGHAQLEIHPLGQRRLVAVMGADHALAGRDQVSPADLVNTDLVVMSEGNPLRAVILEAFTLAGAALHPRLEAVTQRAAAEMALSAGAVALVDQDMAQNLARHQVPIRSAVFSAIPAWDLIALRSREQPATPLATAALARFRAEIQI